MIILISYVLGQQSPQYKATFKAKTVNPPKHIESIGDVQYRLSFTKDGTIDVFHFGGKKILPPAAAGNSDDITFDNLSIAPDIPLSPALYNLSEEDCLFWQKSRHLGLLYSIYEKAKVLPGCTRAGDEHILTLLRNKLSNNIVNKEEVLQEFISLWNEIAASSQAKENLGRKPSTENTLFTYHGGFIKTIGDYMWSIAKKFSISPFHENFLKKIISAHPLENHERLMSMLKDDMVLSTTQDLIVPLLYPVPLEFHPPEFQSTFRAWFAAMTEATVIDEKTLESYPYKKLHQALSASNTALKEAGYDLHEDLLSRRDRYTVQMDKSLTQSEREEKTTKEEREEKTAKEESESNSYKRSRKRYPR